MNTSSITIEHGYTVASPIHLDHKRAKNWAAVVRRDLSAPGGLARKFLFAARGTEAGGHSVDGITAGAVIEYAADYTSGGGRVSRDRLYARVVSVTATELALETHGTASAAFTAAATASASVSPAPAPALTLDFSVISTADLLAELARRNVPA